MKSLKDIANRLDDIKEEINDLNKTINDYKEIISNLLLKQKLDGIEVTPEQFADIYDDVIGKMFDSDGQQIMDEILDNSPITIEWRGIKCSFENCAAISNILIEGIRETWEECVC